ARSSAVAENRLAIPMPWTAPPRLPKEKRNSPKVKTQAQIEAEYVKYRSAVIKDFLLTLRQL
ncbi:MAG: hypothetical protein Q4G62_02020, partial [Pseudomonadota bacterium]|nr:hypothetical protein [Pseudomonadota bacterium]